MFLWKLSLNYVSCRKIYLLKLCVSSWVFLTKKIIQKGISPAHQLSLELTHAECVRVGHAGSDLHFIVRALSAGLTGFGAPQVLRKRSWATYLALRVSLWATLPDSSLTMTTFGARCTQFISGHEEVTSVTFTLCVLGGRARSKHGKTEWALGTWWATIEAFRWGKCS